MNILEHRLHIYTKDTIYKIFYSVDQSTILKGIILNANCCKNGTDWPRALSLRIYSSH